MTPKHSHSWPPARDCNLSSDLEAFSIKGSPIWPFFLSGERFGETQQHPWRSSLSVALAGQHVTQSLGTPLRHP